MKIWIKVILGIIIGTILGILLPGANQEVYGVVRTIVQGIMQLGQYTLIPLLFTGIVVAVYQLKEDSKLGKILIENIILGMFFTIGCVLFGIISAVIFQPAIIREIPGITEPSIQLEPIENILLQLFPANLFDVFNVQSGFLLPMTILAIIIGLTFSAEKIVLKPILPLFDSFSRLFYSINNIIVEFIGVGVIAFGIYNVFLFKSVKDFELYFGAIMLIIVDVFIIVFVVIPLILYFVLKRKNPFKYIFALFAPSLLALASGNVVFSYTTLLKHSKESLGIRRRSNSISIAFSSVFARSGSAMVAGITFLLILRSRSILGGSINEILWIMLFSMIVSVFSSVTPTKSSSIIIIPLVMLLCNLKGSDVTWKNFQPIAFILVSIGAFLDVIIAGTISLIIAEINHLREDKATRHFI